MNFKYKLLNFRIFFLEVVFKISLLLLIIFPLFLFYMNFFGVKNFEPKYFYTVQVEGKPKIEKIDMINRPILSTPLVKQWVTKSLLNIYNYSSTNYLDKKRYIYKDFSSSYAPTFWSNYVKGVKNNVSTGVQIADAIVSQNPVVVKEATINGMKGWKFYLELYHVYRSEIYSNGIPKMNYLIVTVLEQNTDISKKGVAIDYIKIK